MSSGGDFFYEQTDSKTIAICSSSTLKNKHVFKHGHQIKNYCLSQDGLFLITAQSDMIVM